VQVTKLKIENFRGIEELELDLDHSTVLIGANNVGKTSVLAALDAALGRQSGRGARFADYDHRRSGSDRDLPDGHQVTITVTFTESEEEPWPAAPAQALNNVVQLLPDGRRTIVIRVRDTYDAQAREFSLETVFLNLEGEPLRERQSPERMLRRFAPVFYLPPERSAGSDFRSGARFWAPFLKDPSLSLAKRRELEQKLREISAEVSAAAPNLSTLRQVLDGSGKLINLQDKDPISLEPLPTRLPEVLRRTEVRLTTPTGASVSLGEHGGGAQNVAVLFLFQAYLATTLAAEYEPEASPILAIEEPEAHLHPAATRQAWNILAKMDGQKVIATHSGDLLSQVPIRDVRRLARDGASIKAHRLQPRTLTPAEVRKVDFHIRRTRGELLFGDVWLLGEGESEFWVFTGAAEGLGIDLEHAGVRIVDCGQSGTGHLIKVADDLGIGWHCVADGDAQGENTAKAVRKLLGKKQGEDEHLTLLKYHCIEHLLCAEGLGDVYEAAFEPHELAGLPAKGDQERWSELAKLVKNRRKIRLAVEVGELLSNKGRGVPPGVESILETTLRLIPN
jgi:putative ATP-dependent endonuclease of OLD family